MSMRCSDLLKIPSLEKMKLIGGAAGIDRVIRWTYIAEAMSNIEDTIDWIVGNELVIITGSSFNGDLQKVIDLIPKYNDKKVAGIVINTGNYIPCIPQEIINICDKLQLPLFELLWEARLVNITHDIGSAIITKEIEEDTSDHLLESILFGNVTSQDDLADALSRFGFKSNNVYFIGILEISNFSHYLNKRKIRHTSNIYAIKNFLHDTLKNAFANRNINVLTMFKNDTVIFMMESSPFTHQTLERIVDEVKAHMSQRFPELELHAGIGTNFTDVCLLCKSYKQAEQALKASKCDQAEHIVYSYNEIGVYSLLMNIHDHKILEDYYHNNFDILIEYDKANKCHLLKTLEVYITNNCKISTTAKLLYIHENTLKYRLNKIESLTKCNMRDIQQLVKYYIGIKISRFLY